MGAINRRSSGLWRSALLALFVAWDVLCWDWISMGMRWRTVYDSCELTAEVSVGPCKMSSSLGACASREVFGPMSWSADGWDGNDEVYEHGATDLEWN